MCRMANSDKNVTSPLPLTGKGCLKGGKGAALLIFRARRFSPNSVENDRLILEAVAHEMEAMGYEVRRKLLRLVYCQRRI